MQWAEAEETSNVKNEHTTLVILGGLAVVVYLMYRFTGAASNCSFIDAITGKCGVS